MNLIDKAKFILVMTALLLFSCKQDTSRPIDRSFYYWKTVYSLSGYEKKLLNQLNVHTLYIHFFDVDWNNETNNTVPSARIRFNDTSYKSFNIIPVVFITNEALIKSNIEDMDSLSKKICDLITTIIHDNTIRRMNEIQFDCDWTSGTRDKYFRLLTAARSSLQAQGLASITISATIRLHQCKYVSREGVPPGDKGLLMCYNMGNLQKIATKNSILESNELKKYTSSLSEYPLPLDVAFPLFDWKVLFRNGRYAGLVKELPDTLLKHIPSITINKNFYTFLNDTSLNNYSFKKGDILRDEQSDYDEIIQAGEMISQKLKRSHMHIILYHLDSLTLSKYTLNELENIFNCFH